MKKAIWDKPARKLAVCALVALFFCAPALAQITVTLDTPHGGESWEAGSTHKLTWESSGTPDSVNLYYSVNNGASYTPIASGQPDNHSYPWLVPVSVTNQAKVSIEAVKTVEVVTAESAPFTIYLDSKPPVVTVVTPNTGEAWAGGTVHNIVFTATDESGLKPNSLYIWYSTDHGFSYPYLITSDAAVASPYAWTTPSLSTTEVKVRVSVKDNAVAANPGTDESDVKFTIDSTPPVVTLIQPNSGEALWGGGTYEVKWVIATDECGLPANPITLRYATDAGFVFNLIASNQANNGSYIWTVPLLSNSFLTRVSVEVMNSAGLVGTDMSNNNFTVNTDILGPTITIDAPAGGEKWRGGTIHSITFEASDNQSGVKPNSLSIWYSTDGGLTYPNLVTAEAAVVSPYAWTTPTNVSTTDVKVRLTVLDVSQNAATKDCTAKFTVDSTPPIVTVTFPNGGEPLNGNSPYSVTWIATDECGTANATTLRYSLNSGASWTQFATGQAASGSCTWTTPYVTTSEARVSAEVQNQAGLVGTDMSNNDFTILGDLIGPTITIDAPVGGEKWRGGTIHPITFEASDPSGVNANSLSIWYSTDNGLSYPNLVTAGASVVSPYAWTTPSNVSTTEVKVRLTLLDNALNASTKECTAKFTVDSTPPIVAVSTPNGGESLNGNATYEVRWTATDECGLLASPNPITLRYSTNSGVTWTFIASNEINDGSYIWTVPYINSATARVSVEALNQVGLVGTDMSDGDFTIVGDRTGPTITIDAPVGGEKWRGGTVHPVTFEASDPSGIKANSLSIWYSTDHGLSYPNLVTAGASAVSPYSWTTPSNLSTTEVKVRLTLLDTELNASTKESTAKFTIDSTPPIVTVSFPIGGESLNGNSPYSITWTATD